MSLQDEDENEAFMELASIEYDGALKVEDTKEVDFQEESWGALDSIVQRYTSFQAISLSEWKLLNEEIKRRHESSKNQKEKKDDNKSKRKKKVVS